jgi:hypothetical protein
MVESKSGLCFGFSMGFGRGMVMALAAAVIAENESHEGSLRSIDGALSE